MWRQTTYILHLKGKIVSTISAIITIRGLIGAQIYKSLNQPSAIPGFAKA